MSAVHGNGVIVDLSDDRPVVVAERNPSARALQLGHHLERLVPQYANEDLPRLRRHRAHCSLPGVLRADRLGSSEVDGKLQRPDARAVILAAAMTKGDARGP